MDNFLERHSAVRQIITLNLKAGPDSQYLH
jgi:hypothetical protein